MNAFRVIALGYAISAVLIAPSWLSADELPAPDVAPAAEEAVPSPAPTEEPAPAQEPPAEAAPADEAPVAVEQDAQEQTVEEEAQPVAKVAKEGEPKAKVSADGSVTITDFEFSPKSITVNEGDSITFTNDGPTLHTATAEDGSFDTGNLDKGESDTVTFRDAGRIPYICTPHPFMKGTVVVKAASSGTGGDSGSADDDDEDDEPVATTADDSDDDDDDLPATGLETLAIALLGMATLASGLILRRREQARD